MVRSRDWDRIRAHVAARVDGRCEACGHRPAGVGHDRIEVHERWRYGADGTQALMRLIALCHRCHEATHMGLAQVRGRGEAAMRHLRRVAGLSEAEAWSHRREAFALFLERSQRPWSTDVSMLTAAGIELTPGLEERVRAGRERIAREQLARDERERSC